MNVQRVAIPYSPRPLQRELHKTMRRFNVIVAHRRFGKTVLTLNHLLKAALTCELERPRFAYITPFRTQAKTVAWDYLKHYADPVPGRQYNEAELRCDLPNGGRVTLFGADNADALRGQYFDGVVLDEFAQMSPRVWSEVVRPALADRKGWAIFIGTPMGENQFFDVYEAAKQAGGEWFAAMYKASETGLIDAGELADARRVMTKPQYAQEFECSFAAAILGAVYGDEIERAVNEKRICSVPWERSVEVHVSFDLGMADTTTMWWWQEVGREIRVLESYENNGVGLDHYAQIIKDRPYSYGKFFLPHDVEVRELGTGKSRAETLRALGIRPNVMPRTSPEDRINALRMSFDRMWFDEEKCADGIKALRQYRYEYDDKRRAFRPRPLHDWASHYADAAGLMAEALTVARPRKAMPKRDTTWVV